MTRGRPLALAAIALLFSAQATQAQGRAHYRDFQLGGNLTSVAALSGAQASEAKTIHQRPALMQDLAWRPAYFSGSTPAPPDPLQQIVFSFYNDQLFRMVVDYDRHRTEGMTDADMIEAISAQYGPTTAPTMKKIGAAVSQADQESGPAVARWGDADYSVGLYRSSYASGFKLIVTSLQLDALARTAVAQALLMDERDAPQREVAREKKEADDARTSQQKARAANKAAFKP